MFAGVLCHGAGLAEFSEFASVPTRAEDIATRARALQPIAAVNGQILGAELAAGAKWKFAEGVLMAERKGTICLNQL